MVRLRRRDSRIMLLTLQKYPSIHWRSSRFSLGTPSPHLRNNAANVIRFQFNPAPKTQEETIKHWTSIKTYPIEKHPLQDRLQQRLQQAKTIKTKGD